MPGAGARSVAVTVERALATSASLAPLAGPKRLGSVARRVGATGAGVGAGVGTGVGCGVGCGAGGRATVKLSAGLVPVWPSPSSRTACAV